MPDYEVLCCIGCEYEDVDDRALCDICPHKNTIVAEPSIYFVPEMDDGCKWVQPKPTAQ